jgi:hypothetical protein
MQIISASIYCSFFFASLANWQKNKAQRNVSGREEKGNFLFALMVAVTCILVAEMGRGTVGSLASPFSSTPPSPCKSSAIMHLQGTPFPRNQRPGLSAEDRLSCILLGQILEQRTFFAENSSLKAF